MCFESLLDLRAETEPFTYVQAFQTLASTFLGIRSPAWARRLLGRAVAVLRKNDIRFVSHIEAQPIPAFSDEIHERVVCLSQLVYAQICLDLLGESEDTLVDLENQMEQELQVFTCCSAHRLSLTSCYSRSLTQ